MPQQPSKEDVAAAIVHAALRSAGVPLAPAQSLPLAVPTALSLDEIVPHYDKSGLARFTYGLKHAAKGLELSDTVSPGELQISEIVASIAARLPARLYRCQYVDDIHFYKDKGTGLCRIDKTELIEVIF